MSEPEPTCPCGRPLALRGERFRGTCNGCDLLASRTPPLADATTGWPLHSDAMGVHPEQVPEEMAALKRLGVDTRYDDKGRPILENRRHRKAHMKALGLVDRNSFTGY